MPNERKKKEEESPDSDYEFSIRERGVEGEDLDREKKIGLSAMEVHHVLLILM